MTDTKLDFEKQEDARAYLNGKNKVKVQIMRGFRGIKHDESRPDDDPKVVSLRGFRKAISGGDTGKPGLSATVGEYVMLACPTDDPRHGQDKLQVSAWAIKDGDTPARIRFVSDAEFRQGTGGGKAK